MTRVFIFILYSKEIRIIFMGLNTDNVVALILTRKNNLNGRNTGHLFYNLPSSWFQAFKFEYDLLSRFFYSERSKSNLIETLKNLKVFLVYSERYSFQVSKEQAKKLLSEINKMSANQKILEILIAEMGAETILAICQQVLDSKKAPTTPTVHRAASTMAEPKAPVKIIGVKIKSNKDATVKNLTEELAAVAVKPSEPSTSSSSSFTCPPCGGGKGDDHRLCVLNAFNCDVAAWETACGLRAEAPKVKSKVVIKKKEAPAPVPAPVVVEEAKKEEEPKKTGRPKKVVADAPRCDARIYGEQLEIEGTKAPNGKALHCFRPSQCERKGGVTLAVNEDDEVRKLNDDEQPGEDDGKFHLCKVCVNRWEAREEHGDNWHGFFDDEGAPETSHFLDGAWYKKKLAAVKVKSDE